jgi:lysophospholipase L1-like esterase
VSRPDIRVCFLGDSFTLGTGDDAGLGWAGRVHADARGRGVDLSSYNLGIRGQTGAEIAERASAEISVRIAERGERRGVVLSFGANDIRLERPLAESAQAAECVLRWAASQGYQAFVMGPPPDLDPDTDAARALMSAELGRVASMLAVPFLDVRAVLDDWSVWHHECGQGDGIHPNAEGYRRVAEVFCAWKPWRDWLDG